MSEPSKSPYEIIADLTEMVALHGQALESVARQITALTQVIGRLNERITHLENGTQP